MTLVPVCLSAYWDRNHEHIGPSWEKSKRQSKKRDSGQNSCLTKLGFSNFGPHQMEEIRTDWRDFFVLGEHLLKVSTVQWLSAGKSKSLRPFTGSVFISTVLEFLKFYHFSYVCLSQKIVSLLAESIESDKTYSITSRTVLMKTCNVF